MTQPSRPRSSCVMVLYVAVQVRLQQPGSPYSSSSQVVAAVIKADGVRGLWKGATPGVVSKRFR
jgi:hypothetical protein